VGTQFFYFGAEFRNGLVRVAYRREQPVKHTVQARNLPVVALDRFVVFAFQTLQDASLYQRHLFESRQPIIPPGFSHSHSPTRRLSLVTALVGLGRVELPTSPLSGVRSNQLSYRPPGLGSQIPNPKPQAPNWWS